MAVLTTGVQSSGEQEAMKVREGKIESLFARIDRQIRLTADQKERALTLTWRLFAVYRAKGFANSAAQARLQTRRRPTNPRQRPVHRLHR